MLDSQLVSVKRLGPMAVIHWASLEFTNLRKWSNSVSPVQMVMILGRCTKRCSSILKISIRRYISSIWKLFLAYYPQFLDLIRSLPPNASAENSLSSCVHSFWCIKWCSSQKVWSRRVVSCIKNIQGVGFLFKLHRLPSETSGNWLWSEKGDTLRPFFLFSYEICSLELLKLQISAFSFSFVVLCVLSWGKEWLLWYLSYGYFDLCRMMSNQNSLSTFLILR